MEEIDSRETVEAIRREHLEASSRDAGKRPETPQDRCQPGTLLADSWHRRRESDRTSGFRNLSRKNAIALTALLLTALSGCGDTTPAADPQPSAPPTATSVSPAGTESTEVGPTPEPTEEEPTTKTVDPLDDPETGSCITISGAVNPEAQPASSCRKGTYKIRKRIGGTTDDQACENVSRTTHSYVVTVYTITTRNGVEISRTPNTGASYVLCLREQ